MGKQKSIAPDEAVLDALVSSIGAAKEPIALSKLRSGLKGPLKRTEDEIAVLLERVGAAGRVFRFAPYLGKSPRYWLQDARALARELVEKSLGKKSQSAADLFKAIGKRIGDFSLADCRAVLDCLVREKRLFPVPGATQRAAARYSLAPPDPREYLQKPVKQWRTALERICRSLEPYGLPAAQVVSAAVEMLAGLSAAETAGPRTPSHASVDFAARFDAAFLQLDRQKGSHNFVSLVDLRRAFDGMSREEFNRGLRDLRRSGQFELSGGESVRGLRPEDREAGIEEAGILLLYASRKSR